MLPDFYRASVAHCQYFLVYNYADALRNDTRLDAIPQVKRVLTDFFFLFSIHTLESVAATDLLVCGYLSSQHYDYLADEMLRLLAKVRPNAVATVDAFMIPDYQLNSALGRYDGKVEKIL